MANLKHRGPLWLELSLPQLDTLQQALAGYHQQITLDLEENRRVAELCEMLEQRLRILHDVAAVSNDPDHAPVGTEA